MGRPRARLPGAPPPRHLCFFLCHLLVRRGHEIVRRELLLPKRRGPRLPSVRGAGGDELAVRDGGEAGEGVSVLWIYDRRAEARWVEGEWLVSTFFKQIRADLVSLFLQASAFSEEDMGDLDVFTF